MRKAWLGLATSFFWVFAWSAAGGTVTVNGQTPGPTPFISIVDMTVSKPSALQSIQFEVASKPGSAVRPIRAKYSRAYLQARGYLDLQTGEVTLPVFGLYADFTNSVKLKATFKDGSARRLTLAIPTQPFDDPTGVYVNPTVLRARSSAQKLSYDYIMLKGYPRRAVPGHHRYGRGGPVGGHGERIEHARDPVSERDLRRERHDSHANGVRRHVQRPRRLREAWASSASTTTSTPASAEY